MLWALHNLKVTLLQIFSSKTLKGEMDINQVLEIQSEREKKDNQKKKDNCEEDHAYKFPRDATPSKNKN